jgi:tetracycline 7-halogenase / FADH2 O2-dependent halogenase
VSPAPRFDVAVVGSGFGGSILARGLAAVGRRVVLVERQRHPRFALGESATPLAAIALERLAARPGLADLAALAAAGRWRRELPEVRHGVKRGFTFYAHRPGEPFDQGPANERRLLVAASPDGQVADSHWLRADLDHHLAAAARAAGVEVWEGTEVEAVELGDAGVRLSLRGAGGEGREEGDERQDPRAGGVATAAARLVAAPHDDRFEVAADFLVDASGPGGLARLLGVAVRSDPPPHTALLFGHFAGVGRFAEAAAAGGTAFEPGPYPDDAAAVHHLLAEGWMYVLRFAPESAAEAAPGGALTSAGFVLRRDAADRLAAAHPHPAAAWAALLSRYPTLAAQFAAAPPVRPIAWRRPVAHRLEAAAGPRWLALPHVVAFHDPLFSTGIAWTLVAVERALDLLASGLPLAGRLAAYDDLLQREADHVGRLVTGAWAVLDQPTAFFAWSHLYFAAASFAEASQRLLDGDHAWSGFLGAADAETDRFVRDGHELVTRPGGRPPAAELAEWVRRAIVPRNVAGLANPARRNLYPVDLEVLIARAELLGLRPEEAARRVGRLRRV